MHKTKHWLVSLLLILFTGYYGGITLFPHVHEVDGQRIVHSHPYSGQASQPGHQHSGQQLLLINLLSLLTLLGLVTGYLRGPLSGYRRMCYALPEHRTESQHIRCRRLRGPPTL